MGRTLRPQQQPRPRPVQKIESDLLAAAAASELETEELFKNWPLRVGLAVNAGRGVFATRDLVAGELVLAADIQAVAIEKRHRCTVCHHCLRYSKTVDSETAGDTSETCEDAFVPCVCCGAVAYCSQACANADAVRHGFECKTLAHIEASQPPKEQANLARLLCGFVASALARADAPLASGPASAPEVRDVAAAPTMESEPMKVSLGSVLGLMRDNAAMSQFRRRQQQRRLAVNLFAKASEGTQLDSRFDPVELEAALAAAPLNDFGLFGEAQEPRGTVIATAAALFNHMCTPNLARRIEGRQIRFYMLCGVTSGTELRNSYLCRDFTVEERRKVLWDTWRIECHCTRCLGGTATVAALAEMTAIDAHCGCVCGGFRVPEQAHGIGGSSVPSDRCWCLAGQQTC